MTTIRIGIGLQGNKTPAEYIELAHICDRYDFAVISVYNDLMYQPAIAPLMIMAPHIHRAAIGPAILNPFIIHPVEIAGQMAMLDLVTNGRAYFGLGRGAWLDAIDREPKRPLAALRETVLLFKHLLRRDPAPFEGEVFTMRSGAFKFETLRPNMPITIGTWGPETCRMAGELADEVKIGGSANPAVVRHLRTFVDAGSAKAGRPAGSVGLCLGGVTVIDADREVARRLARRQITPYLPIIAALDPSIEDRGWLDRVADANRDGTINDLADAMPDDLLDKFAFSGNADDLIRQISLAAAGGASRVELGTPHGIHEADAIEMIGKQVLPHFR